MTTKPFLRQTKPAWRRQDGVTMLEAMVGLTVMSIVGVATTVVINSTMKSQKHAQTFGDRSTLQNMVIKSIDCGQTIAANNLDVTACSSGSLVSLVDSSGNVVINNLDSAPTQLGEWTLRARCYDNSTGGQMGIHVEVARPKASNPNPLTSTSATGFYSDQMNPNIVFNWVGGNSKMSLFATGAQLCRREFLPIVCPVTQAMEGGLPIPANQDDPSQCLAAATNVGGLPVAVNAVGQRTCKYYAPLVHGIYLTPTTCNKTGPNTWMFMANGNNADQTEHYYNKVYCPAGWKAIDGSGDCAAMSVVGFQGGGFYVSGGSGHDVTGDFWTLHCAGFYQGGSTHEAIDNAVSVTCIEQ